MAKIRTSRLSAEYRKAVYEIITTKVKDADITEMVSVMNVDVTPDLKHAKVYLSVFSKDETRKKATFDAIARSAGFIRRELAHMMSTRTVPELNFILDDSMDYSDKINRLLKDIEDKNE